MTNEEFISSISLPEEEWRVIPNWERYAVSSTGRIASLGAPYKCGNKTCIRKPQLITPIAKNNNPPYFAITLSDGNGHRKSVLVHRMVATAFIPNPNNLPFVNHKDENAQNNRADNLEWCTQQYNCNYGTHNIRMAKTISDTAYQRKKVVQLSTDNAFIASFISIEKASKALNINRNCISGCCRKKIKSAGGFKWMFLSDYEPPASKSKNSLPIQD